MEELEIIRHQQIEGLSLFLDTVDFRTSHFHPEWELFWALDNPLQVVSGSQSFVAQPGQLVVLNPNAPHEFHRVEKDCTFLCLQASPRLFPATENLAVDGFVADEFLDTAPLRQALSQAAYSFFYQKPRFELEVLGLVQLIFYRIFTQMPCHTMTVEEAQSRDRRNARLKRLQKFVDENYMHKIRLSDFALEEGCSMSYLSHFVKDSLSLTFQDYVNTVRFQCACRLIASGDRKMLDVCMESGFSDYRYFTRTFRQQCGMTPEQYRLSLGVQTRRAAAPRRNLRSQEQFFTPEQSIAFLDGILQTGSAASGD